MKKLFVLLFVILVTPDVHAQLLMEKSRVQLTVSPGETIVDAMFVHNTGKKDVDIRVYWQDYEYLPPYEGKKHFSPPGTSDYSMGEWISYSPQVLTIPAQGKREIRYTIKVPPDAQGGHYGVLFFEQALTQSAVDTGVNIITRLGSLFYVETVDSDRNARIDNVRIQDEFLKAKITNEGNVYLFPRGVYYLVDMNGVAVDRGTLDTMYIMPGASADFMVLISNLLEEGDYTMVVTFDLGDGESIVKEVDLTKFNTGQYQIRQLRD